jgi:hypothetical protein
MPASGPAAPTSSSARREAMERGIEMTAPQVPKGEIGIGKKSGSDAGTRWMRAAK